MLEEGKQADAKLMIKEKLLKINLKHSDTISSGNKVGNLRMSLDGSTLFWIQSRKLHYYEDKKKESVPIPLSGTPIFLNPSWSGRYVAILFQIKGKCIPEVISVEQKKVFQKNLPIVECGNMPSVSDDGSFFSYSKKGSIHHMVLDPALEKTPLTLSSKHFVPKYKNIKNYFYLYSYGEKSILILFGSAGYYQFYRYDVEQERLQKHPKILASHRIFPSFHPDNAEKIPSPELLRSPKEKLRYKLNLADAFVYSGDTGRHKIHPIRFQNGFSIGSGFSCHPAKDLGFLPSRNIFLVLIRDDQLYWFDPVEKKKLTFPLPISQMLTFRGGFVYTDFADRIHVRKKPFSEYETDLISLYNTSDTPSDL